MVRAISSRRERGLNPPRPFVESGSSAVTTPRSPRLNGHLMAIDHSHTSDLERLLRTLRRRRRLIALCTLGVAAAAIFFALRQQRHNSAKAPLAFRDPGLH